MTRLPVSPETCTVLGYRVTASNPMWAGLDLARAEPLNQSTLMLAVVGPDDAPIDVHLNVPWCHPHDRASGMNDDNCRYRVRPRMKVGKRWKGRLVKTVTFEQCNGEWFIAVEFARRAA